MSYENRPPPIVDPRISIERKKLEREKCERLRAEIEAQFGPVDRGNIKRLGATSKWM